MKAFLFCVLALLFVCVRSQPEILGVLSEFSNNTQIATYAVSFTPSGETNNLVELMVSYNFFENSAGISGYDFKRHTFYTAFNFGDSFLFQVNLTTLTSVPVNIPGIEEYYSIDSDPWNDLLYISAKVEMEDKRMENCVLSLPLNGNASPTLIRKFKEIEMSSIDYVEGNYYYFSQNTIYVFPFDNPEELESFPVVCDYIVDFFAYDYVFEGLVGFGSITEKSGVSKSAFLEFAHNTTNNTLNCVPSPVPRLDHKDKGDTFLFDYDPVGQVFYFNYISISNNDFEFMTYDVQQKQVGSIAKIPFAFSDIQVVYTPPTPPK
eukprot:TRINITY_DN289_c0_g1_i1.p1 TRINITY_DN289_c0_g1~~TRINITY_DN289_c0_g1_i1.p1  ORF type:complete len:320 (-),score=74.68 TRINITY_DN289_c0_g1_i1:233-1192(-)